MPHNGIYLQPNGCQIMQFYSSNAVGILSCHTLPCQICVVIRLPTYHWVLSLKKTTTPCGFECNHKAVAVTLKYIKWMISLYQNAGSPRDDG